MVKSEDEKEQIKWQFCPLKKCYNCKRDLEKYYSNNGTIVTSCPYCSRSFVE